jgi:hypothetical protein
VQSSLTTQIQSSIVCAWIDSTWSRNSSGSGSKVAIAIATRAPSPSARAISSGSIEGRPDTRIRPTGASAVVPSASVALTATSISPAGGASTATIAQNPLL